MNDFFRRVATRISEGVGSPWTFMGALCVIVLWAVSGPLFGFSDTWQLVINTGTTIITFLMVFLVQNTQNRDAKATHLKLDELLRASTEARTGLVNPESLSDEQLQELQKQFERMQDSRVIEEDVEGQLHEEVHTEVTKHLESKPDDQLERASR